MLIHAIARISLSIVDDFGVFLTSIGFPLGTLLAWFIKSMELIGSILMFFNYKVKYLCSYFIIQLVMGIILVHFNEGWFVVGAGRNGMEYSILLICCFVVIGINDFVKNNSK